MSVRCTICLCLQSPVPHHSLNVTVENVSQVPTAVLVMIHAQMTVMKRDVVSTSCTHIKKPMHNVMDMDRPT